ncbi:WD40 repeat-like protein [Laetiporus sulphureus 93-53]|uniref:DNA damage-binding protein CMR1 n=1 Tax=Laetiporus sulphureus 93-53 TaxID=1314785 RepID=A0A165H5I5_9APHY|nr:WD40 repeat-like protein [Laetiporus sulphureus 93-53]KZT11271.1 WD40 repeat-like protein [Laetiporus sulphureus 93-53]
MSDLSDYELEREANIARNREILAKLDLTVDLPPAKKPTPQPTAKPVQPSKKAKVKKEVAAPVRQSARLRRATVDPNESPAKKRKREAEEEKMRRKEEEERLEAEERERQAKKPRHNDIDLATVMEGQDETDIGTLRTMLQSILQETHPRRLVAHDAFTFDSDEKEEAAVAELKERLEHLKVVARAKVTEDRIYTAAYHAEPTKDLIFFGDKHGQLGIWDARAPSDEVADEDGDVTPAATEESGKYWRLQLHWPATSRSSISSIKFDPINSHSIYTSSYDCTVRCLSFTSGISTEIFSTEEALISCIDLPPNGNQMWISDAVGGLTHLDLREGKGSARWYQVSDHKIGSVSVNPTNPHLLVTASNSRTMKIWDTRKLQKVAMQSNDDSEFNHDVISDYLASSKGKGCMRADWRHNKSVSSAYWDPRGRSIVSTSYDDTLRLWEFQGSVLKRDSAFPSSRPFSQIKHNCQTGRWLTVLRAQWSPNPDYYPHFTVGNMEHSLDIFSCKGDLLAHLYDRQRITAVQAVTCSHPSVLERAASGNASGRCVLWAPPDD